MTKSEAFLAQAISEFRVFELLLKQDRNQVPACHPGHYLQMSMEKLAKAALQRAGHDPGYTHEAFSLLRRHLKRRDVARALGYSNFSTFRDFLDRSARLFSQVEALHPDVPKDSGGPNVEYPWEARNASLEATWEAPAAHEFLILKDLQGTSDGNQLISMIRLLLERFETVFPL
jgi:hypothetical protein